MLNNQPLKKREKILAFSFYRNLGALFQSTAEYQNAKNATILAILINNEIGNKKEEATCYGDLGTVSKSVGEFQKGKEYVVSDL